MESTQLGNSSKSRPSQSCRDRCLIAKHRDICKVFSISKSACLVIATVCISHVEPTKRLVVKLPANEVGARPFWPKHLVGRVTLPNNIQNNSNLCVETD